MTSPDAGADEEAPGAVDAPVVGVGGVAQDLSSKLPAIVDPNIKNSRRPNLLLIALTNPHKESDW